MQKLRKLGTTVLTVIGALSVAGFANDLAATARIRAQPDNPLTRMEQALERCHALKQPYVEICMSDTWNRLRDDMDFYIVSCDISKVGHFEFGLNEYQRPFLGTPIFYNVPFYFFLGSCHSWPG
ncbi:MAG TPA: hypothetical protein VEA36_03605 [Candidatus Paceibacterota bacterium]|nr:hypothetical protein [Candidatus Paceibacterota bacterium]